MKRIRKFNESTTDLDYDYIYNCFAELIDDNKAAIFPFQNDHQRYISIYLKMKPFSSVEVGTLAFSNLPQTVRTTKVGKSEKIINSKIFDFIDGVRYNYELLQEVEVALKRLSDEYPEYKINFEIFDNTHSMHIDITL
jgi:hypothetical protein